MKLIGKTKSKDGITTKSIYKTNDDHLVEIVYVDYENKHIICYPTQIGCYNKCKFCFSGIMNNYIRGLTAEEMYSLCVLTVPREAYNHDKPLLFSAMGTGDAFNNFDEWEICLKDLYSNYSYAKYAVSSCLPNPYIDIEKLEIMKNKTFFEDINLKLMISIHTPFDDQRKQLMPSAGDLDSIFLHAGLYIAKGGNVEFNYTLINGINDTEWHAKLLVEKIKKSMYLCNRLNKFIIKINKFNKISRLSYEPSTPEQTKLFINILEDGGLQVEYYQTNGDDIDAACGQLGQGGIE